VPKMWGRSQTVRDSRGVQTTWSKGQALLRSVRLARRQFTSTSKPNQEYLDQMNPHQKFTVALDANLHCPGVIEEIFKISLSPESLAASS
jgi:hypothetical protein